MAEDHKAAYITCFSVLGAAVIAGIFGLCIAVVPYCLKEEPEPEKHVPEGTTIGIKASVDRPALRFTEVKAISQKVNDKTSLPDEKELGNEERANFIFTVRNSGRADIRVDLSWFTVNWNSW